MSYQDVIVINRRVKNAGYLIVFIILLFWIWSSSLYLNSTKISFSSEISYARNDSSAGKRSSLDSGSSAMLSRIFQLNQTKLSLASEIQQLTFVRNWLKSEVDRVNFTLKQLTTSQTQSSGAQNQPNINASHPNQNVKYSSLQNQTWNKPNEDISSPLIDNRRKIESNQIVSSLSLKNEPPIIENEYREVQSETAFRTINENENKGDQNGALLLPKIENESSDQPNEMALSASLSSPPDGTQTLSGPQTASLSSPSSPPDETQTCQIPDFNKIEEDLESNSAFHSVPPLECRVLQPELTYVTQGKLHWDVSLLQSLANDDWRELLSNRQSDKVESSCFVRLISRVSDFAVDYSAKLWLHPLDGPVTVNASLVSVTCHSLGDILYSNVHANILYNIVQAEPGVHTNIVQVEPSEEVTLEEVKGPPSVEPSEKVALEEVKGPPSVLLIMVESLSRVNGQRQLPSTVDTLKNVYNATIFTGVTKVGDNTFPNLVGLLTGLWVGPRDETDTAEVDPYLAGDQDTHDKLPFVWNQFSGRGCATFYSEDAPDISAFNYQRKGFSQPPTHHYGRTFFVAAASDPVLRQSDEGCVGHRPNWSHQMEHAKLFLEANRNRCSMSLVFHGQVGHAKDMNKVSVLDSDLSSWLRENALLLKDTVVIVAGDHGNRFPNIKESLGRRVEERMPFLAISLPTALRDNKPQLQTNLEANKNRLISHFDIHKTLVDMSSLNSPPLSQQTIIKTKGDSTRTPGDSSHTPGHSSRTPGHSSRTPISLLSRIPSSRTCAGAGIPAPYCLCHNEAEISVNDSRAIQAAEAVINKINNLMDRFKDSCSEQKLALVVRCQLVEGLGVRVALSTQSGARVEALVIEGQVQGDIHRLDYGGITQWCVPIDYYQLFCNCI